jgi:hypothetical protein
VTTVVLLVVLVAVVGLAVAAGRLGADSRPTDPRDCEPTWPFVRHRS